MKFIPGIRLKAGIEILSENIKSAVLLKNKNGFFIQKLSHVNLPEDTIKPSFKMENIINPKAFDACLKKSHKEIGLKKIGISLPDACVKILIKEFKEVPKGSRDIHEMVLWTISSSLKIPIEELRVSWKNMGRNSENKYVFFISLGLDPVLVQYEEAFKKTGFFPLRLAPGGLNRFNFYCERLPQKGCVAFWGLFDAFLQIFVFVDGIPIFYRIIKKGLLSINNTSAIDDINLVIQYFYAENPDLKIDSLHIASHLKSEVQIQQILQGMSSLEFKMMDEKQLMEFEKSSHPTTQGMSLAFYTGALGAAMGV